jgi:cytochrome c5
MRIFPIIMLLIVISLLCCQKKAAPIITERKASPPIKKISVYPPVANIAADTLQGKALFQTSCKRCHGLPELPVHSIKSWDAILATMFPKTGLSTEEAYHVRAYVLANALTD